MGPDDDAHQLRRSGQIAHAPAAHGIGFGEGLHGNGALLHSRQGGNGDMTVSIVQNLLIGFVCQNQQVMFLTEGG